MAIICSKIVNFTRRMATGISFGRQRTIAPVIRRPLPSGILNIAISVTPPPVFFYPASRHHILILSVRRFIAINRTPALWPGISLIPISAFCSTGTIRPLLPHWKGDRSKHWYSARQPVLMMSNKHWYFRAENVCTKQSYCATFPNSLSGKHYRPAHGRVSALISTSAHPKPGLKSCSRASVGTLHWIKPGKLLRPGI